MSSLSRRCALQAQIRILDCDLEKRKKKKKKAPIIQGLFFSPIIWCTAQHTRGWRPISLAAVKLKSAGAAGEKKERLRSFGGFLGDWFLRLQLSA